MEFDHKFKYKSSGYNVTESSTVELQVVQQGRPSSKNTKLYKVDLTQDQVREYNKFYELCKGYGQGHGPDRRQARTSSPKLCASVGLGFCAFGLRRENCGFSGVENRQWAAALVAETKRWERLTVGSRFRNDFRRQNEHYLYLDDIIFYRGDGLGAEDDNTANYNHRYKAPTTCVCV